MLVEAARTPPSLTRRLIKVDFKVQGATGKAGNGKRDGNGNGNGNGKREREFAQKAKRRPLQDLCSLTAPGMTRRRRSRRSCSRTKEHNNGLRVSSFGSGVKTRGSVCGETGTHAHYRTIDTVITQHSLGL